MRLVGMMKAQKVKEQGADYIINITGSEDSPVASFRHAVKDVTNGAGVDVAYDGVGGAISLGAVMRFFGARYLIVGWAATPFVAKGKQGNPIRCYQPIL